MSGPVSIAVGGVLILFGLWRFYARESMRRRWLEGGAWSSLDQGSRELLVKWASMLMGPFLILIGVLLVLGTVLRR